MTKSREKLLILSIVALVASAMLFLAYSLYHRIHSSNSAPKIFCATDVIYADVNATNEELLIGVSAVDAEDGDLTSSVVIGSISSFIGEGKCEITYAVFDSGNKVATATRQVHYTNYHSPRFVLADDLLYYTSELINPLKSIRAVDCFDGDLTNRISMSWVESETDQRTVEFQVTNSRGDISTLVADVAVVEKTSQLVPEIVLSDYLVYLDSGTMFDPLDYIKSITVSKKIYTLSEYGSDKLHFDFSGFDRSVPGTYKITIFCDNGDAVGSAELIVIVED